MSLLKKFMDIATIEAFHSHDDETYVGCVIVNEKREIATQASNQFVSEAGYHYLPRTRPNKYFYIQHAETRAIYQAAKDGVAINKSVAICTHSPCINCARALFQAGVKTIYFKIWRDETDILNYTRDIKGKLIKLKSGLYKLKLSIRK